jgi:hypothetical protein
MAWKKQHRHRGSYSTGLALLNHLEKIQAKNSSTVSVWKKQYRHKELFNRVNPCNPVEKLKSQMA